MNKVNFLSRLPEKHLFLLAFLSAITYNSWILGYILNRSEINNAYFSVLESPHKPHYLLYIGLDIISGVLVFLIGLYLLNNYKMYRKILLTYLAFGGLIALDAVYPITDKCSSSISVCGSGLAQILSYHDLISIAEFISIFILLNFIRKLTKLHHHVRYKKLIKFNFYLYIFSIIFLIVSIPIDKFTGLSQGVVVLLSGLAMMLVPLTIVVDTHREILPKK